MKDNAENTVARLWRDRAQVREQERNEAQIQTRIAQEKAARLTAENDRLAGENARLRGQNDRLAIELARLGALLFPDPAVARAETERKIEALRVELLSLLPQRTGRNLH